MQVVKVPEAQGESLLRQLYSLYVVFKNIRHEKVVFDFQDVKWIFPTLILPIASYIYYTDSDFLPPTRPDVNSYLTIINFPKGISSASELKKRERSYIPITLLNDDDPIERAKLQSEFLEMIYKVLAPSVEVKNAIYYPIEELVENIFQHSQKNEGFVFAQYYPTKKFLELSIVDRGIGIANSYKKRRGLEVSDEEAIKLALEGYSAKDDSRGYGVRTSKRVICEGLGGEFLLISGSAAFYSSDDKNLMYKLPDFYWDGVIISYKIPKPKHPVDIYSFLEG